METNVEQLQLSLESLLTHYPVSFELGEKGFKYQAPLACLLGTKTLVRYKNTLLNTLNGILC